MQVFGQGRGVGVVDEDGGGQGEPVGGGEGVAQFHGGEGVKAGLAEGTGGGETIAAAEDGGGFGLDQVGQDSESGTGVQAGQAGANGRWGGSGDVRGAAHGPNEGPQQGRDE